MKKFKDHIVQITQTKDRDYYNNLTDVERRSFNTYLILKYLSYCYELIPILSEYQSIVEQLPPDRLYLVLIEIIPKGDYIFKFTRRRKIGTYLNSEVELISKYYGCSKNQGKDYIDVLRGIGEYDSEIKRIYNFYGK